jgi:hypothetical protein
LSDASHTGRFAPKIMNVDNIPTRVDHDPRRAVSSVTGRKAFKSWTKKIKKKVLKIHDLYIDIGATSKGYGKPRRRLAA